MEEYETLIDQNRIWLKRTKDIGVLSREEAINWGLSGATLRGSGIDYERICVEGPVMRAERLAW